MKELIYICAVVLLHFTAAVEDEVNCLEDGQEFIAHPTRCAKFVECNNGEAVVHDCIGDFHFNPALGWCDFPENVGCTVEDNIDIGSGDYDNDDEYEQGDVGSGIEGDDEEDDVADVEEDVDNEEGSGDNEEEGGDNNEDIVGDNEEEGDNEDDNVSDIEEEGGDNEEDNVSDNEDGGEDNEEEGNVSDNEDGGEDNEEDDVGDNEEEGGQEEEEAEDEENDGQCPSTGQHFFPHPYTCSKFIECNNGDYRVSDCIDGLHFDPSLGFCDFPDNVGCVDSTPAPPTTEEPTTTEDPNANGGPVGECPATNGVWGVYLPDSRDCTIFYKCDWGVPIERSCGTLHFNPILNVCDWPQFAGCTAGQ